MSLDGNGLASPADSARSPHPQPPRRPGGALRAWVPIRALSPRHRDRLQRHLLALDEQDRYLRFGHPVTDTQIERYVAALDFERDTVFGIFNRRLELSATAHLAFESPGADGRATRAEFGVSVARQARGHGLGTRLFRHAAMHARNRRIDTLYIHALSENTAMLKIARQAGARVERDGPEAAAYLQLPAGSLASQVEELLETQAAELAYQWRRNAHRFTQLARAVAGARASDVRR